MGKRDSGGSAIADRRCCAAGYAMDQHGLGSAQRAELAAGLAAPGAALSGACLGLGSAGAVCARRWTGGELAGGGPGVYQPRVFPGGGIAQAHAGLDVAQPTGADDDANACGIARGALAGLVDLGVEHGGLLVDCGAGGDGVSATAAGVFGCPLSL